MTEPSYKETKKNRNNKNAKTFIVKKVTKFNYVRACSVLVDFKVDYFKHGTFFWTI